MNAPAHEASLSSESRSRPSPIAREGAVAKWNASLAFRSVVEATADKAGLGVGEMPPSPALHQHANDCLAIHPRGVPGFAFLVDLRRQIPAEQLEHLGRRTGAAGRGCAA